MFAILQCFWFGDDFLKFRGSALNGDTFLNSMIGDSERNDVHLEGTSMSLFFYHESIQDVKFDQFEASDSSTLSPMRILCLSWNGKIFLLMRLPWKINQAQTIAITLKSVLRIILGGKTGCTFKFLTNWWGGRKILDAHREAFQTSH